MAKLTLNNLALEIRFKEFDQHNWIQYEILFLYNNQSMIEDHLLKRINEHWANRSPGAFKANEYEFDRFISFLQKALDTDTSDYYMPTDPDIILAIYPRSSFPYTISDLKPNKRLTDAIDSVSEDSALIREIAGGRLPGDTFTVILMVDVYNFGRESAYTGQGPALILMPTREELRKFCDELQSEYDEFCHMWEIYPGPQSSLDE